MWKAHEKEEDFQASENWMPDAWLHLEGAWGHLVGLSSG